MRTVKEAWHFRGAGRPFKRPALHKTAPPVRHAPANRSAFNSRLFIAQFAGINKLNVPSVVIIEVVTTCHIFVEGGACACRVLATGANLTSIACSTRRFSIIHWNFACVCRNLVCGLSICRS